MEVGNLLMIQGVREYISDNYDFLGGYWLPEDRQLSNINRIFYGELFDKFINNSKIKQNTDVMYGPILKSYIENIVNQLNKRGIVVLKKADDDIEIDEGYEAFNTSVDRYHEFCKENFNREPVHDVEQVFTGNRKKAEETYLKISND